MQSTESMNIIIFFSLLSAEILSQDLLNHYLWSTHYSLDIGARAKGKKEKSHTLSSQGTYIKMRKMEVNQMITLDLQIHIII